MRKKKSEYIHVRLSKDEKAALNYLSRLENVGISEIIRRLIRRQFVEKGDEKMTF